MPLLNQNHLVVLTKIFGEVPKYKLNLSAVSAVIPRTPFKIAEDLVGEIPMSYVNL